MIKDYTEGMRMLDFKHIPSISKYNCNYYEGVNGDLLYAEGDDDNWTEWWLVLGKRSVPLGDSNLIDGDRIELGEHL